MARHARPSGAANSAEHRTRSQRGAEARVRKAEKRRLAEREQVSGEIRTPAEITARRARRSDKPQRASTRPSKKTPVSAQALVPERTFSGRLIVLTIVTLVVISFLVPTVRTYFQQNAEMEALSEQIAQEEQRQAELYSQLQRWDDPEFVRQQARERINLVMPGERRYHVIGDLSEADVENVADEVAEDEDEWTETLWESVVESADE
ncbi:septum formation initiator family protein [Garicola koreensis]|uniref:Cell division protein FtsB n=1 Tax=Garicola koreensis TaxID=1262554 RepID=A0A7W5TRL6_9MICC|nr:cell division protein FtsB [Garicola koreensis]